VLTQLGSAPTGLSTAEAARRLAQDGPNVLQETTHISGWRLLTRQFKSVVVWILIAAGVLSGVLGEVLEAIAILAVVVLNAAIGFYQEFKAEKSIAALKLMTAPKAKVLRDGARVEIRATGLVVGDVLTLEAGDLVAADARLLKLASLLPTLISSPTNLLSLRQPPKSWPPGTGSQRPLLLSVVWLP
jgi:Ca2+-transporting ATPase